MCGILFVANRIFGSGTTGFVKDAFLASQVRGMDSSGLFQIAHNGDMRYVKKNVNASQFLEDKEADKYISEVGGQNLTVGHVRAATQGNITSDNAHPFRADRPDGTYIIGVHNGTLAGWKYKKDADKFEVDSAWAMHMLAMEGADAFEHFTGAFALVWYDSAHPDSFFIAKNKERPLYYMVDRDRKSMVGCSELGMLGWLTTRNGLKLSEKGKKFDTPYYIEDGKIYQFSLTKMGSFKCLGNYPAYDPNTTVTRPFVPALPPPNTSTHGTTRHTDLTHYSTPGRTAATTTNAEDEEALMDRWDRESGWVDSFNDDIEEWQRAGYQTSSSPGWVRQQEDRSWSERRQEQILDNVKKALKENSSRYVTTEPVIIDADALDRALHTALTTQMQSTEPAPVTVLSKSEAVLDKGELFLTSVSSGSATKGEIAEAKEVGMFGMVVNFEGLEYDDDLKVLLGTFSVLIEGTRYYYDGEIRYLTKTVADDIYCKGKKSIAVVIGCKMKPDNKSIDWAVLERPNAEQRLLAMSQIEKFSKAS